MEPSRCDSGQIFWVLKLKVVENCADETYKTKNINNEHKKKIGATEAEAEADYGEEVAVPPIVHVNIFLHSTFPKS